MLHLIPRSPRKISTSELSQELLDKGYAISQRSIQRDLQALSTLFPLTVDERSKPYGWSWAKDGNVMNIPALDSHVAITFNLVEQYLKPMLPPGVAGHLTPHFAAARKVLDSSDDPRSVFNWRNKIRVVHPGPNMTAPDIVPEVQEVIYEALLHNRRFMADYASRASGDTKTFKVNPLALILKEDLFYLACTVNDYQDIRLLVPQRMENAILKDEPSFVPDGFNLDDYLESGHLQFETSGLVKFQALFDKEAAFHLGERKLNSDQALTEQDDGKILVIATVNDSIEFRWWVLGFGAAVEVLYPIELREWIKQTVSGMHALYSK